MAILFIVLLTTACRLQSQCKFVLSALSFLNYHTQQIGFDVPARNRFLVFYINNSQILSKKVKLWDCKFERYLVFVFSTSAIDLNLESSDKNRSRIKRRIKRYDLAHLMFSRKMKNEFRILGKSNLFSIKMVSTAKMYNKYICIDQICKQKRLLIG